MIRHLYVQPPTYQFGGRWSLGWVFFLITPHEVKPCGGEGCKGGLSTAQIDFRTEMAIGGSPGTYSQSNVNLSDLTEQRLREIASKLGWTGPNNDLFVKEALETVWDAAEEFGVTVPGVYEAPKKRRKAKA